MKLPKLENESTTELDISDIESEQFLSQNLFETEQFLKLKRLIKRFKIENEELFTHKPSDSDILNTNLTPTSTLSTQNSLNRRISQAKILHSKSQSHPASRLGNRWSLTIEEVINENRKSVENLNKYQNSIKSSIQ